MAPASPAPDHEQIRAAVTARYSGLARAARAGQQITDCVPMAGAGPGHGRAEKGAGRAAGASTEFAGVPTSAGRLAAPWPRRA